MDIIQRCLALGVNVVETLSPKGSKSIAYCTDAKLGEMRKTHPIGRVWRPEWRGRVETQGPKGVHR